MPPISTAVLNTLALKNIVIIIINYCSDGKTKVKVIAGKSLGAKAVIDTRTPIMFLDIHVEASGTFVQEIPERYNGFAYVWRGAGSFTDDTVPVDMGQVKAKINVTGGMMNVVNSCLSL